jgi:hypothetical protein
LDGSFQVQPRPTKMRLPNIFGRRVKIKDDDDEREAGREGK